MFQISSLYGTSFTLVKTAPNIRGFDKDISKRCVIDVKTLSLICNDIMMNLIRFNKTP